jgi:hypothetical protein
MFHGGESSPFTYTPSCRYSPESDMQVLLFLFLSVAFAQAAPLAELPSLPPLTIHLPGLYGTFRAHMSISEVTAAAAPEALTPSDLYESAYWLSCYVTRDDVPYGLRLDMLNDTLESITLNTDSDGLAEWFHKLLAQLPADSVKHDSLRADHESTDLWHMTGLTLSAAQDTSGYKYEILFLHPEPKKNGKR